MTRWQLEPPAVDQPLFPESCRLFRHSLKFPEAACFRLPSHQTKKSRCPGLPVVIECCDSRYLQTGSEVSSDHLKAPIHPVPGLVKFTFLGCAHFGGRRWGIAALHGGCPPELLNPTCGPPPNVFPATSSTRLLLHQTAQRSRQIHQGLFPYGKPTSRGIQ